MVYKWRRILILISFLNDTKTFSLYIEQQENILKMYLFYKGYFGMSQILLVLSLCLRR